MLKQAFGLVFNVFCCTVEKFSYKLSFFMINDELLVINDEFS